MKKTALRVVTDTMSTLLGLTMFNMFIVRRLLGHSLRDDDAPRKLSALSSFIYSIFSRVSDACFVRLLFNMLVLQYFLHAVIDDLNQANLKVTVVFLHLVRSDVAVQQYRQHFILQGKVTALVRSGEHLLY